MSQKIHDKYGKSLLRAIADTKFIESGEAIRVHYGGGITAVIDGVIEDQCAIEIESRVAKQVRGALLDLLCHPLSKKLLVLVPVHMNNPEATAEHCKEILNMYKKSNEHIEVILLHGSGEDPKPREDRELIEQALKLLGCLS